MVAENIEKYRLIINTAYAAILVLMLLVMVMYVAKYINVKSEEET